MGCGRMKRLIKIWLCVLFHKKEIKEARVRDELFTFNMGTFKGCSRCDIWRQIPDTGDGL